jgi:two-component system cell cycle sensor histidine kinase PleC
MARNSKRPQGQTVAPPLESPSTTADRRGAVRGAIAAMHSRLLHLRDAYRASLDPKTDAEARLVSAQLTMIRNSSRHHWLLLPGIGLAIALNAVAETVPLGRAMAWWIPLAVLFAGAGLLGRYRPPERTNPAAREVAAASKSFTVVAAVVTIAWCAMIPALWVPDDTVNHLVLILVIASSMASSASINAPHLASGRICLGIYGFALAITPVLVGQYFNGFFEMMALVFWVSMTFQLHSNYEMTRNMLLLQDERSSLIDNLKHAMTESERARGRAEQASQAKSQFLANMSHELRTPLNAILGFSEMIHLEAAAETQARHREYARLVHESGHHLLALINDILDLAKIEAGGLQLSEKDVDLADVIDDTVRMMDAKARGEGVALVCNLSETMPLVRADERAIRQIVLNLLSNAIKFTPPGGEVEAFARLDPDGAPTFGVRDTGTGIAEDDQPRVFETFGQGRHDVATLEKGTGLGLAIVKGLVAAHGGEVTLASRLGEGTCVSIRLPAGRCRARELRSAS